MMKKLKTLPRAGSGKLSELIDNYNKLGDEQHLEKLFYLQKINYFFQKTTTKPELIAWRNQLGEEGLEAHLQRAGIHRDGSQLLQSIEFAKAVQLYTPKKIESSKRSLFEAMTARDALLNKEPSEETLAEYALLNQEIMLHYNSDKKLQDKIQRSLIFLGLTYAKIDAIKGSVIQYFDEYQTRTLGNPEGNNKNFILTIGDDTKVVIRVEDRHNLSNEQVLQTQPVSEYFSEDYATIMVPFSVEGEVDYQPVVISELASQGDLLSYVKTLKGAEEDKVVNEAQYFFIQLNDFCMKLMESGHYHPDIKLSNFLTDGDRVIISDRKTFTDKKTPKITEISSSPLFGAPEYTACLTDSADKLKASAYRTTLDMPSYMAYQLGMALKQFLFTGIERIDDDQFSEWSAFTNNPDEPNNALKNMDALIQELTRDNPKDRLSIQNFQTLLKKAHKLSHAEFMMQLERLSPSEKLSTYPKIEQLKQVLNADRLTPELKKQLDELKSDPSLQKLCQDHRSNVTSLLAGNPLRHVNDYLKQVNTQLLKMDYKKASAFEKLLSFVGINVPRRTTIKDLEEPLPRMNEMTQFCFSISDSIPNIPPTTRTQLSEIIQLRQSPLHHSDSTSSIIDHLKNTSKEGLRNELIHSNMIINEDQEPAGNMVIKGNEEPAGSNMVITGNEEPSGTMVITGNEEPSGTMMLKEDSNSITTPDGSIQEIPKDKMKEALAYAKQNKEDVIDVAPVGIDIAKTIKRGEM